MRPGTGLREVFSHEGTKARRHEVKKARRARVGAARVAVEPEALRRAGCAMSRWWRGIRQRSCGGLWSGWCVVRQSFKRSARGQVIYVNVELNFSMRPPHYQHPPCHQRPTLLQCFQAKCRTLISTPPALRWAQSAFYLGRQGSRRLIR